MLSVHVQPLIHQHPQFLFLFSYSQFLHSPVCIDTGGCLNSGVAPCTWFHEVPVDLLLEFVQVPLDGILSIRHVTHTTQLGVICKLAEGALNATVYIIDEDMKQCSSQSEGHHLSLISIWTLSHCPLQPIPHLTHSPSIKSISLQFREKGVVRNCVKGLTDVQITSIALPLSTDVAPSSQELTGSLVFLLTDFQFPLQAGNSSQVYEHSIFIMMF